MKAAGRRLLLLAVLPALLLAGCAPQFGQAGSPLCSQRGLDGSLPVVLEAQAVPSASLLPCIKLLPAGWGFGSMLMQSGRARFSLINDRFGMQAVTVVLQPACDTSDAAEVPSDEERTHRYERIDSLKGGFRGTRSYVFPGGCVTYRFNFQGQPGAAIPANEATLALGFVSRQAVQNMLDKVYEGRFKLNSPAAP